jgi:hypothetical protein
VAERSAELPFIFAASAALASPGPIAFATSAAQLFSARSSEEPLGNNIFIIISSITGYGPEVSNLKYPIFSGERLYVSAFRYGKTAAIFNRCLIVLHRRGYLKTFDPETALKNTDIPFLI